MTLTIEQHTARQSGLGGSDIAAALGLNARKTPVQLWLEKTGRAEQEDLSDNEAVYWGNVLEDVIAQEYSRRTGKKLLRIDETLRHPEHDWMLGHIDRDIAGEPGGLEIKTAGAWAGRGEWGDEGTDEVPLPYLIQCATYIAVRNAPWWDLAVLRGGQQFRIYRIHRDLELESEMIRQAGSFWRCVVEDKPPPAISADDLTRLYPHDLGTAVTASESVERACRELCDIKDQIKELSRRQVELELEIKSAMTNHAHLLSPDGRELATWKIQASRRLDQKLLSEVHPDLVDQFKVETENRVFRLKVRK